MIAVYKRELRALFNNMLIWVYFAIFFLFSGIFCSVYNLYGGYSRFEIALPDLMIVLLIAIPILTMRSLSDERKNRTDLLLSSLPIRTGDYVIGKYLALLTVNAITSGIMCIMPPFLGVYCVGKMNYLSAYAAILAFFLCSSALYAIGLFISSLTDNVVVSALISFAIMLSIYFMPIIVLLLPQTAVGSLIVLSVLAIIAGGITYIASKNLYASVFIAAIIETTLISLYFFMPDTLEGASAKVFSFISLTERFDIFVQASLFDLSAIIYFIVIAIAFVFFTVQSCDRRRFI